MSNQSKLNNLALKAGAFYLMGQVFIRGLSFLTTILSFPKECRPLQLALFISRGNDAGGCFLS